LGISRQITNELSGSLDYGYNDVRYSNYAKWTKEHPDQKLNDYIKSAISVSMTYNSTDRYYAPTKGIYAKGKIEYAGLGSGDRLAKFIKSTFKFAAYYGLEEQTGYDIILRYKMQAAYIHDLGFTPDAEKLRIGGYYRGVRGYRGASIHPGTGGGMKSMVNSAEISIGLSKKQRLRLTGFADYGMIGNRSLNEVVAKSVGAQIEWKSPVGDVNFIFAKKIGAKPKGSSVNSFEFTIGKQF
jgi:outer membrane protein assembly factor BamA